MHANFLIKTFVKDYKNTVDRTVRERYGTFSCVVGIACNILLFIIKGAAGLLSGSVAIIADALNNLSDMGSAVVVLFGFKMARKPADPEHPFGHGRLEYMSGFIVAVIIILVGFELFRASIDKIRNPETVDFNAITIIIMVLSILIKLWMYFFNKKISRTINSQALKATAVDSLSDCIATFAVIIAVVIQLITGYNFDAYIGLLVAVFIIYSGFKTARETIDPLLGRPPSREFVREIKARTLEYDGFIGVHDLIVHDYGPGRVFASLHVEVAQTADILKIHEQIDTCEKEVGEALEMQMLIHMDPIHTDDVEVEMVRKKIEIGVKMVDTRLSMHDFRMVKGENRTNLIFDVVLPVGFTSTRAEINVKIDAIAKNIDPTYFVVITYDIDLDGDDHGCE